MREKIKLVSSAETGHYYTTTKNKRLHPDKIEVKKFDPVVRKHVMYKEEKIKQLFESFIKQPLRAAIFTSNLISFGESFQGVRQLLLLGNLQSDQS